MVKPYKVVISGRAQKSLTKIINYLRRTKSDQTANHVRKGLLAEINKLKTLPNRHPVLKKSEKTNNTYRFIPKWSYMIIFTVQDEKDKVIVIELFHTSQDDDKLEDLP